jgi:hypothetical protein
MIKIRDGQPPWVAVPLTIVRLLPHDRAYSEAEAFISLSIDHCQNKPATVMGYVKLWGWSRKKVETFLRKSGVYLHRQESTNAKQNQRGQIREQILEKEGADKEQIKLIIYEHIEESGSRKGADISEIGSRSGSTTIENGEGFKEKKKKPLPKVPLERDESTVNVFGVQMTKHQAEGFHRFMKAYPKAVDHKNAARQWRRIEPELYDEVIECAGHLDDEFKAKPSTWLSGRRWQDEMSPPKPKKRYVDPIFAGGI